ncbi:single-stranded-DNA-specific exonuclease RecJ [Brevibacillus laterosporus]|uniref:single-stranded-DNA-specific exonuclease RecJ n=1 Tax=Brevibacillus laterosporus TaxID=1465 RepID=UPI001EF25034|nr:single-stranded-DNA-specific exonuclease RecJ [Brevibacillus laterosporus]MCG7318155.1 single-stranded-DNA-specific exonuclease RecJ [Brevibacillus laterosporus]MED1786424.1 single-stranded-DNA-specific exonuclease RecJ [Brevibacillus laterosporus]
MLQAKSRWQLTPYDEAISAEIAQACGISPLLARLLVQRGMDTSQKARDFLHVSPEQLHDPFLLDGMDKSVHRIQQAIERQEPICIYGDYDADGVSSTALMVHLLRKLGATFDYYIPNRFKEGYGLNQTALSYIYDSGFRLVVTVDTGISAVEQVAHGNQLGLDIIVTDHHEPPELLPDAFAVMNPKKPGCSYPFDMLAGVGVAFKLAHALLKEPPMDLIDLAAIGTIADLVPLVDENRVLASLGLQRLNRTHNVGIQALLDVCGLQEKEITAGHVGFAIGPRINAGGRLETAEAAVKLLVSEDIQEAKEQAEVLDELNRERQELVQAMAEEAIEMVEQLYPADQNGVLVVAKEGWNVGVVGIVASRLVEKFYRPAIVLGIDSEKGTAKGSARSIAGFDMYEALTACKELLPHYGGHTMAAGMTLPVENVDLLRKALHRISQEWLQPEDFIPKTRVDLEVAFDEMSLDLAIELEALAPFGMGNPTPMLVCEEVGHQGMRKIGKDETHLKCVLSQEKSQLDAIGFGFAQIMERVAPISKLSVLGELQINEWNGLRKPQFLLRDVAVKHKQIFDWRGSRDKEKKWLDKIATDELITITFQEANHQRLYSLLASQQLLQRSLLYVTNAGEIQGDWKEGCRSIVLYDLPSSKSALGQAMATLHEMDSVYCLFGEADEAFELLHVPSREDFKALYQIFRQYGKINKAHLDALAKKLKLKRSIVERMLTIFIELRFIEDSEQAYLLHPEPAKAPLDTSSRYQDWREEAELHAELLLSNHDGLGKYLDMLHQP